MRWPMHARTIAARNRHGGVARRGRDPLPLVRRRRCWRWRAYNSGDSSLNNATGREPSNLLGGLGATAADLLLQTFGIAALAALAAARGVGRMRACRTHTFATRCGAPSPGHSEHCLLAAGLGVLPAPIAMPAGSGGLIGLAAAGLSAHVGQVYGQHWIGIALPLLLLIAGLPLAFLATGLRVQPILRFAHQCSGVLRVGCRHASHADFFSSSAQPPNMTKRKTTEEEYRFDEDERRRAFGLSRRARTASQRGPRQARRRSAEARCKIKPPRQPALNLGCGRISIAGAWTCSPNPCSATTIPRSSDDALEENARMLEAVLADFGVHGPHHGRAARPGGDALRIRAGGGREILARDFACRRRRAFDERGGGAHRRHPRAATSSASSCPTRSARRFICASCSAASNMRKRARR